MQLQDDGTETAAGLYKKFEAYTQRPFFFLLVSLVHWIVPCFPVVVLLLLLMTQGASIDGIPLDDRPQLLVVNDVVEKFGGAHHGVW